MIPICSNTADGARDAGGHRGAVAAALSEQEKQRMFARFQARYAAEPLWWHHRFLAPTSPQPVIVLIAAVFAGTSWRASPESSCGPAPLLARHRVGVDRSAGQIT
jgi:hypothetical protein